MLVCTGSGGGTPAAASSADLRMPCIHSLNGCALDIASECTDLGISEMRILIYLSLFTHPDQSVLSDS